MKNETENNAADLPSKDQVIETVIDIFVRVIGFIEREEVSRATHPAIDFYIDTDDLSFYLMEVEKYFGIDVSQEEWLNIGGTIEDVADLVLRHLTKKK